MGMLDGRVAICTGSGRGVGAEVAKLMAANGAKVVVNDPGVSGSGEGGDKSPAEQIAAEIKEAGGDAVANFGSVTKLDDCLGMVKQAKVGYRLFASKIPVFPETIELIRRGARTGVTMSNFETLRPYLKAVEGVPQEYVGLLCDPQTAGGLIMPVAPEKADAALAALQAKGYERATIIGEVYDAGGKAEITLEW